MSFSEELSSYPADKKSRRIIERWLETGNPDELWTQLIGAEERFCNQAPWPERYRLDPQKFISVVLSARYGVDRLTDYEKMVKKQFVALKAELGQLIKAANCPQEIADIFSEFASKFEVLDRSVYDFRVGQPVSRNDRNGSRTKKAFIQRVQSYLEPRCGSKMDRQVTELLDIVFPGKTHNENDVRLTRRPTTKAGRSR